MIAATFKAMYTNQDFSCECEGWKNKKEILQNNLWRYYIYDILTNYWSDGGTSKIYSTDRYFNTIKDSRWIVAIDGYFESSIAKKENNKIKSVSSEDYVFLNCIYLDIFTAKDQLSVDKFDVEHIAPKAQMKKLIQKTHCDGLPISCIANLCYLPEHNNRSKEDKNFYQDTNYNGIVNLNEIEEKFSFTVKEDLDWINKEYGAKDAEVLTNCYINFLKIRFQKLKGLFCERLGIDIANIAEDEVIDDAHIDERIEVDNSITESKSNIDKSKIRAPFKFSMVGLVKGDKVVFKPIGLEVTIANEKEVEYKGKLYTTTSFCREFMPDSMKCASNVYQGPNYFT